MLPHNYVVSSDTASEDDTPFLTIGLIYEGNKVVNFRGKHYRFSTGELFCIGDICCRIENHSSPHRPYKEVALSYSFEELSSLDLLYDDVLATSVLRGRHRDVEPIGVCTADAMTLGIFNALRQMSFRPSFAKRQSILKMLMYGSDSFLVWCVNTAFTIQTSTNWPSNATALVVVSRCCFANATTPRHITISLSNDWRERSRCWLQRPIRYRR